VLLRVRRRSRWQFGIRWSAAIQVFVCSLAVLVGGLMWGWFGAAICVILGEATLAGISLFAGRKLNER
jgi:hypothetical protein